MQVKIACANEVSDNLFDLFDHKEVKSRDAEGVYICYCKARQSQRQIVSEKIKVNVVRNNLYLLRRSINKYLSSCTLFRNPCSIPQMTV